MTHSIKTQAFGSEAQARRGHGEKNRTMRYILDFEGEPMKDEDGELLAFYEEDI